MRDAAQAAYETDSKYNFMQDQQRSFEHREIPPLLPGEHQPRLPPLPPAPPPGAGGPLSPEDQARESAARREAEDAAERQRTKQQQSAPRQLTPSTAPAPAPATPPQSGTSPPPPQDGAPK